MKVLNLYGRKQAGQDASRGGSVKGFRFLRESWFTGSASSAFTLIEIMIVVAIMAIVMSMSIPFAYHAIHKAPLNQAVSDITEVCSNARRLAILHGSKTEVVFHGKDGRFEIVGGAAPVRHEGESAPAPEVIQTAGTPAPSGLTAQLSDKVAIAALRVNGVSLMDAEIARVRFFPNGTCDELRMVLLLPDTRESRGIFLEVTTGLATIEADSAKLVAEIK